MLCAQMHRSSFARQVRSSWLLFFLFRQLVLFAASVQHTGPFTKPPVALANLEKGTRSEVNDGGIKATAMVVPSLHSRGRG